MNHSKSVTVSEIAEHVGGRVLGKGDRLLHGVADLESATEGEIAYVEHEKFFEAARLSSATCLLAPTGFGSAGAETRPQAIIEVSHPKLAFTLAAKLLHPPLHREPF